MELFDISLYFIPWLFESNLFNEQELYSIFTALFLVNKSINTFITDMSYNTCSSKLLNSLFCPSYAKVIDLNTISNRKNCPINSVIVNHNMDKRNYYYNISNCKLIVLINCIISEEFVKNKEYDIYFINCKFTDRIHSIYLKNIGNVYFYNCKNLPNINCNNMLNLELIKCHSNYCIDCGNVDYINIEECIFTISTINNGYNYSTYNSMLYIGQLQSKRKNPDFRLKIRLSKNIITFMNLNIKHDFYIVKNNYSNIYDILDLDYKNNNIFIKYLLDMSNPEKIKITHSKPRLYTRVRKKRKKGKTFITEEIDVELIQDFVEQHYISKINSNLQFPIPNKLNISNKFLCFSQLTTLHVNLCECNSYMFGVFSFINKCKEYLNLQVKIKSDSNLVGLYNQPYTYTISNIISFTIGKNACLKNLKIPNYNSLWDIMIRIIKYNININNDYFDYDSFNISQKN
jgi:hypothetical protein